MKLVWRHAKYGKRKFEGSYYWNHNEREFQLTWSDIKDNLRRISFESHEQAKKLGWVRRKK